MTNREILLDLTDIIRLSDEPGVVLRARRIREHLLSQADAELCQRDPQTSMRGIVGSCQGEVLAAAPLGDVHEGSERMVLLPAAVAAIEVSEQGNPLDNGGDEDDGPCFEEHDFH